MDVATLAEFLHETAEHHDPYEKAASKHDWLDWYAAYITAGQRESTSEEASSAARLIFVHLVPTLELVPTIGVNSIGGAFPHEPTEHDHAVLEDAAAVAVAHAVASHDRPPGRLDRRGDCGRHGAVASALLCSVSLGVLRHSNRPVLIVHGAVDLAEAEPPT